MDPRNIIELVQKNILPVSGLLKDFILFVPWFSGFVNIDRIGNDIYYLLRFLPFNVHLYFIEVLKMLITPFNNMPVFSWPLLNYVIKDHPYI